MNHHVKYTRFVPVFPEESSEAIVCKAQALQQSIGTPAAVEYMKSAGASADLIAATLHLEDCTA